MGEDNIKNFQLMSLKLIALACLRLKVGVVSGKERVPSSSDDYKHNYIFRQKINYHKWDSLCSKTSAKLGSRDHGKDALNPKLY